jgi:ADP-heptose:LPS heptosyltransferase
VSLKKILVLRFSAMGDVVLLVPVIRSLVAAHPHVEVTVVTRPKFAPFFYDLPRVIVVAADVDYTYNGIFGISDLFRMLIRKADYDVVIDAHDHIRTMFLRTFFKLFGTPVIVFDKGRDQKKAFARKDNKVTTPLLHTVDRYKKAFEKAGFSFELLPPPHFIPGEAITTAANDWLVQKKLDKQEKWIGIAPFAMHASKIWPLENYAVVIDSILKKMPSRFFLFGGGPREMKYFESLREKFSQCVIVSGELKIRHEIAIMQKLDLMLCVDSSNMHLAALAGVPLLSVWGGTHPGVGFSALGRGNESIVQISREELPCRPCSVYGREHCYIGGFPCLNRIAPESVAAKIIERISV